MATGALNKCLLIKDTNKKVERHEANNDDDNDTGKQSGMCRGVQLARPASLCRLPA
jgi:hypothetical protein